MEDSNDMPGQRAELDTTDTTGLEVSWLGQAAGLDLRFGRTCHGLVKLGLDFVGLLLSLDSTNNILSERSGDMNEQTVPVLNLEVDSVDVMILDGTSLITTEKADNSIELGR